MNKLCLVMALLMGTMMLSSCSETPEVVTATPAASEQTVQYGEVLEMFDMFDEYSREDEMNTIHFLAEPYDETNSSVQVIFNDHPVTMVVHEGAEILFLMPYDNDSNGNIMYSRMAFDMEGFENYWERVDTSFYAFLNYDDYNLVLIETEMMPEIVDPSSWDGTYAKLAVWTYPNTSHFVENLTTHEVAITPPFIFTFSGDGHRGIMESGDEMWGYLHYEENSELYSWPGLYLTPTQPDFSKLDKVTEIAQDTWPNIQFSGPVDVCMLIGYWTDVTSDEQVILDKLIEYCDVYYTEQGLY